MCFSEKFNVLARWIIEVPIFDIYLILDYRNRARVENAESHRDKVGRSFEHACRLAKTRVYVSPYQPSIVFRFNNAFDLFLGIQNQAADVLSEAARGSMTRIGKDTKGLAAVALYIVAMKTTEKKTQTDFAGVARISEVTLRTNVKEILK